jgi:hypothetical protein
MGFFILEQRDSAVLTRINELGRHWHKLMSLIAGGGLNGEHAYAQRDATNTEEELDRLWLERRQELATAEAALPVPVRSTFTLRERMEYEVHIGPVC